MPWNEDEQQDKANTNQDREEQYHESSLVHQSSNVWFSNA